MGSWNKGRNQMIPWNKWKWEHNNPKLWNSPKREIHSITGLPQETRKISNNVTLYLKELEKEQPKPKVSRRKEIIKTTADINKPESKKIIIK